MTDRPRRFLTIPEVADELATSAAQITALVRRGDLPAFKLGGRGQAYGGPITCDARRPS
jgi:predicted DNA-binding transcriptional regulator AlpA